MQWLNKYKIVLKKVIKKSMIINIERYETLYCSLIYFLDISPNPYMINPFVCLTPPLSYNQLQTLI